MADWTEQDPFWGMTNVFLTKSCHDYFDQDGDMSAMKAQWLSQMNLETLRGSTAVVEQAVSS